MSKKIKPKKQTLWDEPAPIKMNSKFTEKEFKDKWEALNDFKIEPEVFIISKENYDYLEKALKETYKPK